MPEEVNEQLVQIVERWRGSPYDFVIECLGAKPTPQQKDALMAIAKPGARVSITSGHGTGKSTLFSWIAFWCICCFWDVKVAVTAPTSHQLTDILWAEMAKWHSRMLEFWRNAITIKADKVTLNGSPGFIVARTSRKENPEALQGFHAEHMVFLIDEASGVPEQIFEAAQGALSTEGARILMAANPTRLTGYFYNSHHKNRDSWTRFRFSCLDSPNVDKSYPAKIIEDYGEDSDTYRVRVLGEFPLASDLQFIPADVIDRAYGKHLRQEMFNFAPAILGVDVAKFGGDRSVIFLRQGLMSRILFQKRGILPEDLAARAAALWDENKADGCIVDATGVGEAVISSLHLMNRSPIAFYAGERAMLENCLNRRAEVWYKMRQWLREGGAIPPDPDLRDDLVSPEYGYNQRGKIVLEKKEDMKKRGLASPDLADALAVTFAADVQPKVLSGGGFQTAGARREWKPTDMKSRKYKVLDRRR